MNKQYWKYAMNNESEFSKMLSNQGLSPSHGGNSPSSYIMEKTIIKHFKGVNSGSVNNSLLKYLDIDWLERKLNRISDVDELTSLYELLKEDVNKFILKLKSKSK